MLTNPFVHGFANDVHTVREHGTGNFAVYSAVRENVYVRDTHGVKHATVRWRVFITLYGPAWTSKDVERAERNSRYLSPSADGEVAIGVRDHLANAKGMFSLSASSEVK